MNPQLFHPFLESCQLRVMRSLEHWLPNENKIPRRLHSAMRYAVFNHGKRIRPVLIYATGKALGINETELDGPACAVECIHTYSLIHDDLPAMDDDDMRRGQPTCHKVYDEAVAILAGDALQSLAFYILSHDKNIKVGPTIQLKMIEQLSLACGSRGLAGGQDMDLSSIGKNINLTELEDMHIHKTGALIHTSVLLGAFSYPDLTDQQRHKLEHYANCIGLAFQIQDDILDVEGDSATIGKTSGKDMAQKKPTYTSLLGLSGAKEKNRELLKEALASLEQFGQPADELRWIAKYIINRNK